MSVEQQSNDKSRHTPYTGLFLRLILVILLNGLVFPKILERQIIDTDYGTFLSMVAEGNVKQVKIDENRIYFLAVNADNTEALYQTGSINDPELVNRLLDATSPNETGKIVFTQTIPRQNSPLLNFLLMWILPGVIFYFIWKQAAKGIQSRLGGGDNVMSFGKSGAKIYAESEVKTTT